MADKLPSDFNPTAYAAAYPDVAMSGLGAEQHYLRFGRLLGRSPSGKAAEGKVQAVPPSHDPARPPAGPVREPAIAQLTVKIMPSERPVSGGSIIERPADFRPEDIVPAPAPSKAGGGSNEIFGLADFAPSHGDQSSAGTLVAYARMTGSAWTADGKPRFRNPAFQFGEARIENGWFANGETLRLMIGGGEQGDSPRAGWALRAFQALPASPAELRAAGTGITLPKSGPCFVDVALSHSLMPVLLELVDPLGTTRELTLLPFPSLLPGGLHGAEAKALQAADNPMDAFWALSEQLLGELIGDLDAPARSIDRVAIDDEEGGGASLPQEVRDWLAAIFGVTEAIAAPAIGAIAKGLLLQLPASAIPTISAMVSRRLQECVGSTAPYLVARADSRRALSSIALPATFDPPSGVPRLRGPRRARRKASRVPVHLAILYREQGHIPAEASDQAETSHIVPMTVLFDAADPLRTEAMLRALLLSVDTEDLDLWVRCDVRAEMRILLDDVLGAGRWRMLDTHTCLLDVARHARHDLLLTIDDRVRIAGDTVPRLAAMLDDHAVASASCVLLGETMIKKQLVTQPGSGGLFPSGVSFIGGPAMAFAEPDICDSLRDLTYPVVANTLALTVWRRSALIALPDAAGPVPRAAEDIAIGLALVRSGHRNLCTTRFSARRSGDHARRDAIDPLGSAVVEPAQWAELLDRVTIVRELF